MWIWWQIHYKVYFLFFFYSWFPVICNQNQQITHKIAQFQVHTVIKNLAKIITPLLSAVPSSSTRSFPVCPGKVEKLYEHRTIQNVNNYYNLGTGDSRNLKWQNARPVFSKARNCAKIEVKNRENALSIVYPTTESGIRKNLTST